LGIPVGASRSSVVCQRLRHRRIASQSAETVVSGNTVGTLPAQFYAVSSFADSYRLPREVGMMDQ
jgi:hypothetical protein